MTAYKAEYFKLEKKSGIRFLLLESPNNENFHKNVRSEWKRMFQMKNFNTLAKYGFRKN